MKVVIPTSWKQDTSEGNSWRVIMVDRVDYGTRNTVKGALSTDMFAVSQIKDASNNGGLCAKSKHLSWTSCWLFWVGGGGRLSEITRVKYLL